MCKHENTLSVFICACVLPSRACLLSLPLAVQGGGFLGVSESINVHVAVILMLAVMMLLLLCCCYDVAAVVLLL